jgi:hypothetical protein
MKADVNITTLMKQYKDGINGTGVLNCSLGWQVLQTSNFQDDVSYLLLCLK